MKQIYIDFGITQNRFMQIENNKLKKLYVDNLDDGSLTGNIYKARVDYIDEKLKSAFLDIGISKKAILQIGKMNLKKGDEILIQIKSDSEGEKGPKASLELTFPGKNLILIPNSCVVKLSKKIEGSYEILRLNELGIILSKKGYGVIFRHSAISINDDLLLDEFEKLINQWENLYNQLNYIKAPYLIYNQRDFLNFIFTELIDEYDEIIVKDEMSIDRLRNFVNNKKIVVQSNDVIDRNIVNLLNRNHQTQSGAKIVVDEVEAFTIFDVNSSEMFKSESYFYETNKIAAIEIFDLIKLRNIGGIIFIDFIDMNFEDKKNLLKYIEDIFKEDDVPYRIYGWTKLGVLEIMRSKKGKKLKDLIFSDLYKEIYNPYYALKLIEDKCLVNFKQYNKNNFEVLSSREIFSVYEKVNFKEKIKNLYDIDVTLKGQESLQNFKFI